MSYSSKFKVVMLAVSFFLLAMIPPLPEEGMYPLSEIRKLDLKSAGLKISIDELYNPNGISLVDALVNVGGCTGSFVSGEGLILTNHHCVFDEVQKASTTDNNYLENGFLAKSKEEEIPAEGLTCRITESYSDVSAEVLKAADDAGDITKRSEAISKKIREIVQAEEDKDPSIKAEVSEMFVGQSYVLFRYRIIRDVRLVYIPPRAIGEFGGESDNWIWPRHTGDFSFVRAYVAPDGSASEYSEENIPYVPKKFLKVNPNGVDEGDFVFLLGYPGRTFKHYPSYYIEYQQKYQLPYISSFFRWMIDMYEEKAATDEEFELNISSRIKSLANIEKNFRGKMIGLERLNLVGKKNQEEKELQQFINSKPDLKQQYSSLLGDIESVYSQQLERGRLPFIFSNLYRMVTAFNLAYLYVDYIEQIKKPSSERRSIFRDENLPDLLRTIERSYTGFEPEVDKKIFAKILTDAATFNESKDVSPFNRFLTSKEKNINDFLENIYSSSIVFNKEKFSEQFSEDEQLQTDDPLISFAAAVKKSWDSLNREVEVRESKLNVLLASFMDVKKEWMQKSFVPDANRTLRLTYGYVRGYSPADAVYYSPITSLRGLIEKGRDSGEYYLPPVVKKLYEKKDFGKFAHPRLNDVPVAILYNTDTSGGNSGSPILNAYGELIGVNFDRAFEATINDFAWSEDYSRSIGVDIRFILWYTQKIGNADFLLKEMGVNL